MTAFLVTALVLALMGCIAIWLRTDTLKTEKATLEELLKNEQDYVQRQATALGEAREALQNSVQELVDTKALVERQSKAIADAERVMSFFETPVTIQAPTPVSMVETVQSNSVDAGGNPLYKSTVTEYRVETKPVTNKPKKKKAKPKAKPAPKKTKPKAKPKAKR